MKRIVDGHTCTIIHKKKKGWFIGWADDLRGVNCQEKKLGELLSSLKEAITMIEEEDEK